MLEDKRMIFNPKWASSTLRNNGFGGVENFINANTAKKPRKKRNWKSINVQTYKKGAPIVQHGKVLNSQFLFLSENPYQRITETVKSPKS